jgi:NAD(P)-dependent dehydrogenase (short-subunit alcohol dehydrogenase family)
VKRLDGRVALVRGGGRRRRGGTVLGLAAAGAEVVVADRERLSEDQISTFEEET